MKKGRTELGVCIAVMPLHEAQMAEHNVLRPYVANSIIFHGQQWHLREKGGKKVPSNKKLIYKSL